MSPNEDKLAELEVSLHLETVTGMSIRYMKSVYQTLTCEEYVPYILPQLLQRSKKIKPQSLFYDKPDYVKMGYEKWYTNLLLAL